MFGEDLTLGVLVVMLGALVGCGGESTGTAGSGGSGGGGRDASAGGTGGGVAGGSSVGGTLGSGGAGGKGGVAGKGGAGGTSCACPPVACARGFRPVVAPGACCASCEPSPDGGRADASTATDGGAHRCGMRDLDAALPCRGTSVSSLPGVSVRLVPTRCSYSVKEALAGVDVPYDLVVDGQVGAVVPRPLDDGQCGGPGASGLIPWVGVAGGGQSYCICDTGLCAPPAPAPIRLAPGCYQGAAHWQGVNWRGPSDTGNAPGAAFPPGNYVVTLRHAGQVVHDGGTQGFGVDATMVVTITP